MADFVRLFSPGRRLFVGGLVTGVVVVLLIHAWFQNQGPTFYTTRIERSAQGLLETVGCTSIGPGTFAVTGIVIAKADTGVLKFGATIHFGPQSNANDPSSIQASPAYFDTNDPSVTGVPSIYLVAYNGDFENSPINEAPKYCSIFVTEHL